ncbi:MAG: DUF4157 domain-containing protein, partial [Vicinamibacterales bacterium]
MDSAAPKSSAREATNPKAEPARTPALKPGAPGAIHALPGFLSSAGNLAIQRQLTVGPGQPLPSSVRSFFEPRFGADLSQVRVHTDAAAQQSARDIDANAYTVGPNIVFGRGRFAPETEGGRRLLAHELTHTLQQTNGVSVQL